VDRGHLNTVIPEIELVQNCCKKTYVEFKRVKRKKNS
jgi:hypothetical protein